MMKNLQTSYATNYKVILTRAIVNNIINISRL